MESTLAPPAFIPQRLTGGSLNTSSPRDAPWRTAKPPAALAGPVESEGCGVVKAKAAGMSSRNSEGCMHLQVLPWISRNAGRVGGMKFRRKGAEGVASSFIHC